MTRWPRILVAGASTGRLSPWRNARLSARDRRALHVGLSVILPSSIFLGVVRPMARSWSETREALALERRALAGEMALVDAAWRYPQLTSRAERALSGAGPRLFRGDDPLAASAALAHYVAAYAEQSGVEVEQLDMRPADPAGPDVLALEVSLRAQGDLEGLVALLLSLQRGPKMIRVERLAIDAALGSSSQGAALAGDGSNTSGTAPSGASVSDASAVLTITSSIRGFALRAGDARANAAEPSGGQRP